MISAIAAPLHLQCPSISQKASLHNSTKPGNAFLMIDGLPYQIGEFTIKNTPMFLNHSLPAIAKNSQKNKHDKIATNSPHSMTLWSPHDWTWQPLYGTVKSPVTDPHSIGQGLHSAIEWGSVIGDFTTGSHSDAVESPWMTFTLWYWWVLHNWPHSMALRSPP